MDIERSPHPAGYSLAELLVVVALLGVMCLLSAAAWISIRKRSNCTTAAKMVKSFILQGRMLAVYKGIHHFVVFDPATNSLSLYADTNAPLGVFDAGDTRVASETLPLSVRLALPSTPSPLTSPLGTGNITSPWSLPLPSSVTGAWGTNLRGLRMTPTGQIQSAESPPQTVLSGDMVFSDLDGNTVSIGVRGYGGWVRGFLLLNPAWSEI